MTLTNAESGYRKSWDQLKKWAQTKTFPMAHQAGQAWRRVSSQHNRPLYERSWPISSWYEEGDPSDLSLSDMIEYYRQQTTFSRKKPPILEYISQRKDFPKRDRMEFLISVIKDDDNLTAVEYAGRFFRKEAGLDLHPLAVDSYLSWWEKNKDSVD